LIVLLDLAVFAAALVFVEAVFVLVFAAALVEALATARLALFALAFAGAADFFTLLVLALAAAAFDLALDLVFLVRPAAVDRALDVRALGSREVVRDAFLVEDIHLHSHFAPGWRRGIRLPKSHDPEPERHRDAESRLDHAPQSIWRLRTAR